MANIRWQIAQAAEIRWWQNYLKNKKVGDYKNWKKIYWKNLLDTLKVETDGKKILDAGCGPTGIFMLFDSKNGQTVAALDPLLEHYEQKLPHFKRADYPNVTFLAKPLEDFGVKNEYDLIFCINAINHVSDLAASFDALVAAAQTGATLVVSIDAHNFQPLKHIFRALPGDILHPHQFDLEEYKTMLEKRSCEIKNEILYKSEFIFNYYFLIAHKK